MKKTFCGLCYLYLILHVYGRKEEKTNIFRKCFLVNQWSWGAERHPPSVPAWWSFRRGLEDRHPARSGRRSTLYYQTSSARHYARWTSVFFSQPRLSPSRILRRQRVQSTMSSQRQKRIHTAFPAVVSWSSVASCGAARLQYRQGFRVLVVKKMFQMQVVKFRKRSEC